MAYIKTGCFTTNFIQVPQWFITDYMPKALSGYTKVYLYLLALSAHPTNKGICLEDVCSALDMLHSEVIQALKYWDEQKVLVFKEESQNDSVAERCHSYNRYIFSFSKTGI